MQPSPRLLLRFAALALLLPTGLLAQEGDPAVLDRMNAMNAQLSALGLRVAVEQVDFLTIGQGRPSNRIHALTTRFVAGDPRRNADGDHITYLEHTSRLATTSGLTSVQTGAAIDAALATWNDDKCLKKVGIVHNPDPGVDPDIVDGLVGFGTIGTPFFADIVEAGWLPRAFFETIGGAGGGRGIIAVTFTFIFVDADGNPTDINGDNRLDTAFKETYYNDTFGDPADDRAGNPWGIDVPLPGIDVQTVALHENGHALEIGHFGPPPDAVMNPVYGGIRHSPFPVDDAGMCAVWASWPK